MALSRLLDVGQRFTRGVNLVQHDPQRACNTGIKGRNSAREVPSKVRIAESLQADTASPPPSDHTRPAPLRLLTPHL